MSAYLDGFHFCNGDKNGQREAHPYVTAWNEDVMQAVIDDGNTRDARLIGRGIDHQRKTFQPLPLEEKKRWHSHPY